MWEDTEESFFKEFIGSDDYQFQLLPQSGSSRKNFIGIFKDEKFILTSNDNLAENEAFLYFSEVFEHLALNTPKIFKISEDKRMYIQEYLGDQTLFDIISEGSNDNRVKALVKKVLQRLFLLQQATKRGIDYTKTFEYERYDEYPISYDLFYFKFMFADILEVTYHKTRLLKEFKKLQALLENIEPKGIMLRDFQSRNVMVNACDEVLFIDYQSAMYGPLMYDVVSLLFQAKANFSDDFRTDMLNYYYDLWEDSKIKLELKTSLQPLQLIRFLQVLGVYGFRGLVQRKPHFLQSIHQGIQNVSALAERWGKMDEFPELQQVIRQLNSKETQEKISNFIQ